MSGVSPVYSVISGGDCVNKLLSFAPIAGGVAALELSMDDWLRLGLEVALGLLAVFLGSQIPQKKGH